MKIRPGGWCWVGLAAGVVVADAALIKTKNATMSEVFGDALGHPLRRWPVVLAWGILTAHLFGRYVPDALHGLDPISGLARMIQENETPFSTQVEDALTIALSADVYQEAQSQE